MTLRPLRDLEQPTSADEAIASRLARSFPQPTARLIPPARATARGAWTSALRPAVAIAVLAVAAAASAMIGRHYLAQPTAPSIAPPEHVPVARSSARSLAPVMPVPVVEPMPAAVPVVPSSTKPARATSVTPSQDHASDAHSPLALREPTEPSEQSRTPIVVASAPIPAAAEPTTPIVASPEPMPVPSTPAKIADEKIAPAAVAHEDFALLVDAMRALRSGHDPQRAGKLAAQYLDRHPTGALVEEAFAIRVEAAVTAHEPRVRDLATDYLARYPQGRYADAARHAVATP